MGRDEATIAPMIEYLLFARICILSDILDPILSLCKFVYCNVKLQAALTNGFGPNSARLTED